MDFNDTPEEAAFRAEARAWLAANAPPRDAANSLAINQETGDFSAEFPQARAWQARKYDAGFGAIYFPRELGGRSGNALQHMIFMQEEAAFDVPATNHFMIVNRGCCSLLIKHGSQPLHRELIRPSLRADKVWCQLFSEPGAGSDLAGVRTRAERDGDEWVITGQKIWTSNAHLADWGVLVARSDASVPKHKGLSFFIVDMKLSGISTRPIRQLTGGSNFNEVFLDGLRLPDACRIGDVGAGWKVVVSFLAGERSNIAVKELQPLIAALIRLARQVRIGGRPAIEDGGVRERIASFHLREAGVRLTVQRMLTALARNEEPGPEIAIGKLVLGTLVQEMTAFALDLMGSHGAVMDADASPMAGVWQSEWLGSVVDRLGGGTDEIMRNVIGERILGLPEDVRVDKHLPFNQLRA
ncbi:acyl-CoA dehydrogenase family protein [Aquabacterium sp.]|uniref:acyl-CoA dehydrogenase family protein n=1 Tax=Aquabacterium sp. TaxID=1872578 RepID=UPI002C6AB0AC|nr:acyl-CoA dehydrogenase family protein [Aquabacterium sp.]HSW06031.1 acyl-CoA dehydrogenase family protein [Aquabacterium sp.]